MHSQCQPGWGRCILYGEKGRLIAFSPHPFDRDLLFCCNARLSHCVLWFSWQTWLYCRYSGRNFIVIASHIIVVEGHLYAVTAVIFIGWQQRRVCVCVGGDYTRPRKYILIVVRSANGNLKIASCSISSINGSNSLFCMRRVHHPYTGVVTIQLSTTGIAPTAHIKSTQIIIINLIKILFQYFMIDRISNLT